MPSRKGYTTAFQTKSAAVLTERLDQLNPERLITRLLLRIIGEDSDRNCPLFHYLSGVADCAISAHKLDIRKPEQHSTLIDKLAEAMRHQKAQDQAERRLSCLDSHLDAAIERCAPAPARSPSPSPLLP